jgi:hypothetical protein
MVYGTPPPKPAPRTGLGEFLPPFLEPENLPETIETHLPERLTTAALNATYVAAVDEAGAPIPGHAGRIIFNSDGEPLNIVLEEI